MKTLTKASFCRIFASVKPTYTNMENIMLTSHFSRWEMKRSGIAIKKDLCNEPDEEQWKNLQALCTNVLEPLRARYGAVIVTSGFRSRAVNALAGGVPDSQHCRGEAADLYIGSAEKALKYIEFIRRHTDFDQLIVEPRGALPENICWIHVSYTTRRANRRMFLT
ncbi:MAG: D-Ala-D-Ala carboxypeptidase family metallohydrolase [Prevotella sp.]|jgi:hypothetical protein|nr:D-Ala-D-Ala carboxypeptidase family metallohydrolase [Prevotella sp.]MCH4017778.1 D-Ala-D-Ala carboxypeptidase family metallohydrolase [Prevotella sp.]MCI1686290.1 D-Ala-D-Ala carboxypeptidase family metallohydrolase [Prevotella sp.]MCI1781710.1 D-Ala-D-Ala carboxypeptidase family metallohydrolase [Prevotella sp.]MCI1802666.1 D-Ala-D-Ala carboxypeptidase family metallohydrolase [Prevotella sp.]